MDSSGGTVMVTKTCWDSNGGTVIVEKGRWDGFGGKGKVIVEQ